MYFYIIQGWIHQKFLNVRIHLFVILSFVNTTSRLRNESINVANILSIFRVSRHKVYRPLTTSCSYIGVKERRRTCGVLPVSRMIKRNKGIPGSETFSKIADGYTNRRMRIFFSPPFSRRWLNVLWDIFVSSNNHYSLRTITIPSKICIWMIDRFLMKLKFKIKVKWEFEKIRDEKG